jgi:hypothetical protein
MKDGKGKLELKSGYTYEGDFKFNLFNGHGTLSYESQVIHNGEWKDQKPVKSNKS